MLLLRRRYCESKIRRHVSIYRRIIDGRAIMLECIMYALMALLMTSAHGAKSLSAAVTLGNQ